ncbi:STAS domain-containing protein [Jannaschia sp. LMIT008]|uniref:STAS domain-containing protein n=1 Tax=Jannaschia maritima TaxID=3032585 RepID=UPI002811A1EB|nr:STAS domain-containing protein [Jannaschia sp. LMIT008]
MTAKADTADPGPDATATVILPERVDLRTASGVAAEIRDAGDEVTIDANGVGVLTSAGLQVLLSALQDGRRLRIAKPSKAFLDSASLLGVTMERFEPTGRHA